MYVYVYAKCFVKNCGLSQSVKKLFYLSILDICEVETTTIQIKKQGILYFNL